MAAPASDTDGRKSAASNCACASASERHAQDRPSLRRWMDMSLSSLAVAAAVVLMLPAASASAEIRSGSITDPADATLHQNVDGTSYRDQDIQRVTASYDTAGSITMTFYFLDPVPASTPDTLRASFSTASCNYATGTALVTVFPS